MVGAIQARVEIYFGWNGRLKLGRAYLLSEYSSVKWFLKDGGVGVGWVMSKLE